MPLTGQDGSSGGRPRPFVSLLLSSAVGDREVDAVADAKGEAMSLLLEIAQVRGERGERGGGGGGTSFPRRRPLCTGRRPIPKCQRR